MARVGVRRRGGTFEEFTEDLRHSWGRELANTLFGECCEFRAVPCVHLRMMVMPLL